jgi:hypothetical protein
MNESPELRRAARVLTVVGALAIAGWAVPALLMLHRGFAIEDEGTYVLNYLTWRNNHYFPSGAQAFYGPLFEAFHYSIPTLRVVRLLMGVAANAWFGWALVRWLVRHRRLDTSREVRIAGVVVVTASGGLAYLWSPLTPGYYDLAADASLALVTLLLLALTPPLRVRPWVPVVAGAVCFLLVLTKWPAVSVVVVTQVAAVVALGRTSRRYAVLYGALVMAGGVVAAALCQVVGFRLGEIVPAMRRVSALSGRTTHGLGSLLMSYAGTTTLFVVTGLVFAVPALVGYVVTVRRGRPVSVVVGVLLTGIGVPLVTGWRGGDHHGRVMVAVVVGLLLVALIATLFPRGLGLSSLSADETLVLAVLLLVPFCQAVGTNVPMLYVAGECLAMWVGAVLVLAVGLGRPMTAWWAVGSSLGMCVIATSLIAGSTTLMTPFKTTGFTSDTASVPALHGLVLDASDAARYAALDRALAPYVRPGQTRVLTVDEISGYTYALGAMPAGATWTDDSSPSALAQLWRMACHGGTVGDRPVILSDRPLEPVLVSALRACSVDYPAGYQRVPVPGGPTGLMVYVPRAT